MQQYSSSYESTNGGIKLLKECLEVFRCMYEECGEALILDNYTPKDGTYCLIQMKDGIFEKIKQLDIQYDKKAKTVLGQEEGEVYKDICYYDYYSRLTSMNKHMGIKIIHSNNYLSLAVKKESIKEGKLTKEIFDRYYDLMKKTEGKYTDLKGKKLYEQVEETEESIYTDGEHNIIFY